jgi:hypothetical protein
MLHALPESPSSRTFALRRVMAPISARCTTDTKTIIHARIGMSTTANADMAGGAEVNPMTTYAYGDEKCLCASYTYPDKRCPVHKAMACTCLSDPMFGRLNTDPASPKHGG